MEFHLGYGDWIRLLRQDGFEIEELIEIQAPMGAATRCPYVIAQDATLAIRRAVDGQEAIGHGRGTNMDVTLDDIQVMYLRAEGGPTGARAAFEKLEAKLPALRGRKFYGTYQSGEYRACVALLPGDDARQLGMETWVIPGGLYVREKMTEWSSRLPEIGSTFVAMADREKARMDTTRPSIEFYRSQREVILFLPVKR